MYSMCGAWTAGRRRNGHWCVRSIGRRKSRCGSVGCQHVALLACYRSFWSCNPPARAASQHMHSPIQQPYLPPAAHPLSTAGMTPRPRRRSSPTHRRILQPPSSSQILVTPLEKERKKRGEAGSSAPLPSSARLHSGGWRHTRVLPPSTHQRRGESLSPEGCCRGCILYSCCIAVYCIAAV